MRAPSILRSTPPRASRRAGFTLIELMVIVSIIAVMAALAAPGMMRAMSVNRAQRATLDVARIGRAGRSDAISFGRAYMLRVTAGATGRGGVELWRGITDTCPTTPWDTVMAAGDCTADPPAPDCVDHADMDSYATSSSWTTLTTGVQGLCFEPDGDLWEWTGREPPFISPVTAVTMRMQRFESGTPLEQRAVIFPLIGAPRTER